MTSMGVITNLLMVWLAGYLFIKFRYKILLLPAVSFLLGLVASFASWAWTQQAAATGEFPEIGFYSYAATGVIDSIFVLILIGWLVRNKQLRSGDPRWYENEPEVQLPEGGRRDV